VLHNRTAANNTIIPLINFINFSLHRKK